MPFETLLFTCLLPGVHSFQENKTRVHFEPEPGETLLFFCADNHSGADQGCKTCQLRKFLWGKQEGERICDLLIFYAKGDRRVLCFVELKDNKSDLPDAAAQVVNTYRGLRKRLKLSQNYRIQAFLLAHHGSAPVKHHQSTKELKKTFGDGNFIFDGKIDGRSNELADMVRGIAKAKKRKKGKRG